jgi:hypothetical protein
MSLIRDDPRTPTTEQELEEVSSTVRYSMCKYAPDRTGARLVGCHMASGNVVLALLQQVSNLLVVDRNSNRTSRIERLAHARPFFPSCSRVALAGGRNSRIGN